MPIENYYYLSSAAEHAVCSRSLGHLDARISVVVVRRLAHCAASIYRKVKGFLNLDSEHVAPMCSYNYNPVSATRISSDITHSLCELRLALRIVTYGELSAAAERRLLAKYQHVCSGRPLYVSNSLVKPRRCDDDVSLAGYIRTSPLAKNGDV